MTLKRKRTINGLVEIREERDRNVVYVIYVNGIFKEFSPDLNYILRRYDHY